MFSPGLSLVLLAGGETGLPVASVATIGLRLPALARDMEADIEGAVAGDLLVADLVIYISIIRSFPDLQHDSPSGGCLAAGSLAASSPSHGLPSITQGLEISSRTGDYCKKYICII